MVFAWILVFGGISHQRAYFDVRVFNPYAPSYQSVPVSTCYCCNEQQKRRAYDQRVRDVEMGCSHHLSFQLLVAVDQLLMLSLRNWLHALPPARESPTVTLQCHIGFSLMCSAVLCLRGCHSSPGFLPDHSMIDVEGHLQP